MAATRNEGALQTGPFFSLDWLTFSDHTEFGSREPQEVEKGPDDRRGGNAIMHKRLLCALCARDVVCECVQAGKMSNADPQMDRAGQEKCRRRVRGLQEESGRVRRVGNLDL